MKKLITMLTAVSMLTGMAAFPVSAQSNAVCSTASYADATPYYLYTRSSSCTLTISGTTANCTAALTGTAAVNRITGTIYLYKETSTDNWSAISSWSFSVNSNSTTQTKPKSGLGKGTYYAKAVFNVYTSSGSETVTAYSTESSI
ncbi:MAG: hypothetical protein IJ512_03340 [Ruminococcus sp.]|nr:hypothetical protein [Ruminococcus sp.]